MYSIIKKKTFAFINYNKYCIDVLYALIILNVIALILESYADIYKEYEQTFVIFETVSVIIFSLEYILRLWSSTSNTHYKGNNVIKRIRYIFSTYGIIDLLAIMPFYLPLFFTFDLRILRMIRLFRLLRILKIGRYSKSFKTINSVLKETKSELAITVFVAFVLLVISSALMFYIEQDVQPEHFKSIGHSFWWAVATLTTVGYGDVYPVTAMGKVLGGVIALIGVGFVALPTGIISSAFVDKLQKQKQKNAQKKCTCPKCGHDFEA